MSRKWNISHTQEADLPRLLAIYRRARRFMAEQGNPTQWGDRWPPEALLREDIAAGCSYVCKDGSGKIIGTFCYLYGEDVDECYRVIEDGAWSYDLPYGVVHRIASDGTPGVGTFCMRWALGKSGYLRVDTHAANCPMQRVAAKLGMRRCGIIYVREDNEPRIAFDVKNKEA